MFREEAIGYSHLHVLHIGQSPGAFARDCYSLGMYGTHSQGDKPLEPGVAVVDPALNHEAAQSSPYPTIQIPQNARSLY